MRSLLQRCGSSTHLVVATVHSDIVAPLQADLVFDAASGTIHELTWPTPMLHASGHPITPPTRPAPIGHPSRVSRIAEYGHMLRRMPPSVDNICYPYGPYVSCSVRL